MKKTELRSRWSRMLSRCEDEDNPQYADYGGRGIQVCDEWHNFEKFYEWCMSNGIERHLQLDRINNDGPYAPDNCRVVTRKQNVRNRRNTRMLTAFGESKSMASWVEDPRCTVGYTTLARRLQLGWGVEEAFSKPIRPGNFHPGKNANTYDCWGETKTLRQWAQDSRCEVGFTTLRSRIQDGWSVEAALTSPVAYNRGIVIDGKTIFQWSNDEDCEVSYNTLSRRMKSGMPPQEAKRKNPAF